MLYYELLDFFLNSMLTHTSKYSHSTLSRLLKFTYHTDFTWPISSSYLSISLFSFVKKLYRKIFNTNSHLFLSSIFLSNTFKSVFSSWPFWQNNSWQSHKCLQHSHKKNSQFLVLILLIYHSCNIWYNLSHFSFLKDFLLLTSRQHFSCFTSYLIVAAALLGCCFWSARSLKPGVLFSMLYVFTS